MQARSHQHSRSTQKQPAALRRTPLFAGTLACLALLASLPALADEAPQDDGARAQDLDTLVVTANKRVENVRKVGASISVVSEELLQNTGAKQLSDYADFIPGLQVQNNGTPGLTSVSMRGVAALSSGATVATYIDETPVGSSGLYQAATGLMLDLLPYDISRVEVLRGPQGTLYGAGSIGGLLKYVTREPSLSGTDIQVGLGVSSVADGGTGLSGRFGASMPLVEDKLALRVSFARRENPGFTDKVVTDGPGGDVLARLKDVNDNVQTSARAALLFEGEKFSAELSALRQGIDSDDRSGVALDIHTRKPLYGEKVDRSWNQQRFKKDLELFSANLGWDLGFADFVSATGFSRSDTRNLLDATVEYGEVPLLLGLDQSGSHIAYGLELDKFTQEFRLTSKSGGTFEWMIGAFYTDEDAYQSQEVFLHKIDGSPLDAPYGDMFGDMAVLELPSTYKETAVFANGAWRFAGRWKLDMGMRYAKNRQTYTQVVSIDPLGLVGEGVTGGKSDEGVFTWNLSPQFQLSDDVLLYARATTGYQPGGPNVAMAGMPSSADSSMVTSYELGMKAEFADKRVLLDAAVFNIDWEDIQVVNTFNGVNGLVNGGEANSRGIELTAALRATDKLKFGLNAAYTRAELKHDFEPMIIDAGDALIEIVQGLGGERMPETPRLSWSATADYAFELGDNWTGNAGLAYRNVGSRISGTTTRQRVLQADDPSVVLDESFDPPITIDGYRSLDAYVSVSNENWTVRAYVNNVTDRLGWSSMSLSSGALTGTPVQYRGIPIQPRTFGLEFDYRF